MVIVCAGAVIMGHGGQCLSQNMFLLMGSDELLKLKVEIVKNIRKNISLRDWS